MKLAIQILSLGENAPPLGCVGALVLTGAERGNSKAYIRPTAKPARSENFTGLNSEQRVVLLLRLNLLQSLRSIAMDIRVTIAMMMIVIFIFVFLPDVNLCLRNS